MFKRNYRSLDFGLFEKMIKQQQSFVSYKALLTNSPAPLNHSVQMSVLVFIHSMITKWGSLTDRSLLGLGIFANSFHNQTVFRRNRDYLILSCCDSSHNLTNWCCISPLPKHEGAGC